MDISDPSLRPENIFPRCKESPYGISFYQYYLETTSTNDRAKECARAGLPEIGLVVAERQTAGRGRMGRRWISELGGGLWVSILLRPQLSVGQASVLSLAAGVAVYRALKSLYRLDGLSLKWPNDILLSGAKLAGILTEMGSSPEGVNWAVVGIGINVVRTCNAWDRVATPPAFLSEQVGSRVERGSMLLQILEEFGRRYRTADLSPVLAEYVQCCDTLGKDVVCSTRNGTVEGKAVGIDGSGALLVRVRGSEKVIALDAQAVSLRG